MFKPLKQEKFDRKAFFNELACDWDAKFANTVTDDFLRAIVSKLQLASGQKVLDVGTGTGILVPTLSKAVGFSGLVVAVDFAEKMIQECSRKHANLSNVRIELGNVEELDYQSGFFDAVTCFGIFPHIVNKEKALARINRVLKVSGKLMIAHALGSQELNEMHHKEASVIAHDRLPSRTEMMKVLRGNGFSVKYFEDEPRIYLCIATKK